ncbi:hypothetical protein [Streptomyces sp. 1331.2]|uniref:hypothetical protein n=1 Tax=Streptomyces sp. 1331.2 TaxID=1938835 RepID=UPI0015CF5D81|nr:hypothetical protein [Streptomyces sp. 1331.2]
MTPPQPRLSVEVGVVGVVTPPQPRLSEPVTAAVLVAAVLVAAQTPGSSGGR